jgi:cation diffusion facilitator family transporter
VSHANSKKVVIAALAGNLAIATCKFVAAYLSSSTATLAEAVHSLADTGNQGLLLLGMGLALRPSDERFPFGRAAERYFWPFVVAVMLFSVGGAFAIFEGVTHLTGAHASDAPKLISQDVFGTHIEFNSSWLNYGVLGTSIVMEGLSFKVAYGEFKLLAKGKPWQRAISESKDPTIPLVLAEDTTALIGLVIAFIAVGLSNLTGHHWWDPVGSIVIGALLCAVAVVLARITHGLLIGESASTEDQERVLAIVQAVPGVDRVTQLLTMHLGPDVVILALKIAFRPDMRVPEVEDTTNNLEEKLRAEMPWMRKIFVEPDSKGDGRGVTPGKRNSAVVTRDELEEPPAASSAE